MGTNLVAWLRKKQNSISFSTAKAEYIATGSCCTQFLWMKKLLKDCGLNQEKMVVFCYNQSAINISKNPVQHSHTKHIDIRYNFIRELVETSVITLDHVGTKHQLAYLFTKPLDVSCRLDVKTEHVTKYKHLAFPLERDCYLIKTWEAISRSLLKINTTRTQC